MLRAIEATQVFGEADALALLGGDRELLRSLTRLFLELSPLMLGDLTVSFARGDADKVVRVARRLEASASQICAPAAAATARRLALTVHADGLAGAEPMVKQLSKDLSLLHRRLRDEL